MDMCDRDGSRVLCGANHYTKKYYFNEQFSMLPKDVQEELQSLCILYVEDVGGVLLLEFDDEGSLLFQVESEESDGFFDEIGSALKIKEIQQERRPLLESLELFYRTFYLETADV